MGKEKKEKIIYVDDGRTIADMSGVSSSMHIHNRHPAQPRASFREQWQTYWGAVKLMFLPMVAFIGGLALLFGILALVFSVL